MTGYSGYYDGQPHGATGTATGIAGADLSAALNLGGTFTDAPGGTAHWTFTGGTNYNDKSGNVAIDISHWRTDGFYQPVDMTNSSSTIVWNTIKGGSTVPLKFNLWAGTLKKTSTGDVQGFTVLPMPCDGSSLNSEVELTTTGGTTLRYDGTAGQFIQNWQTPKTGNQCYMVRMTAKDGSKIEAYFKTK